MSVFGRILDKLGLGGRTTTSAAPAARPAAPAPAASGAVAPAAAPAAAPVAMAEVDITAKLQQLAQGASQPLNWRTSIVDLLKLLGIDSSLNARRELADELGCPPELKADSAKMNVWLHKAVIRKIAANGGNVPKELLD
jgi:hypothetical protein